MKFWSGCPDYQKSATISMNVIKNITFMGGRGAFDICTMSIPVENRKYKTLAVVDGIKIIEDFESGNGKTPVMSNTANTVYAVWSEAAKRIKHIFYYKDHVLYYVIDLEGKNSHSHKVYVNSETGEIGRKTHDKSNTFALSPKEWNIVNKLTTWIK